jgi:hypothetical protein
VLRAVLILWALGLAVGEFVPFLKVAGVFDVRFQVGYCTAVWAQKIRPGRPVEDWPDALVVPYVGAGSYEKRLAWLE